MLPDNMTITEQYAPQRQHTTFLSCTQHQQPHWQTGSAVRKNTHTCRQQPADVIAACQSARLLRLQHSAKQACTAIHVQGLNRSTPAWHTAQVLR